LCDLRDPGGDDHLLGARDDLRVVALHRAATGSLHQAGVRVGRVDPAGGERVRGRWRWFAPAELASVLGLPGSPPGQILLVGGLFVGLLRFQLLFAAAQPLPPRTRVSQPGRQLVAARVAEALILGGVRFGGLREHPLDLLADRGVAARRSR
jgi:hypothetical protein